MPVITTAPTSGSRLSLGQRGAELAHERGVEGVAGLGSVEAEDQDGVALVADQDGSSAMVLLGVGRSWDAGAPPHGRPPPGAGRAPEGRS